MLSSSLRIRGLKTGAFVGLIILSIVVGCFLFCICKILDSGLTEISKLINFLADHTYHSCEECKDEQEREVEAQERKEELQ